MSTASWPLVPIHGSLDVEDRVSCCCTYCTRGSCCAASFNISRLTDHRTSHALLPPPSSSPWRIHVLIHDGCLLFFFCFSSVFFVILLLLPLLLLLLLFWLCLLLILPFTLSDCQLKRKSQKHGGYDDSQVHQSIERDGQTTSSTTVGIRRTSSASIPRQDFGFLFSHKHLCKSSWR